MSDHRGLPGRALIEGVVTHLDSTWGQVYRTVGPGRSRLSVVPYLAHGNRDVAIVRGRVLADAIVEPVEGVEGLGRRVERMVRRFATNEVPGVTVVTRVGQAEAQDTTDGDGYFITRVDGHDLPADRVLHPLEVEVVGAGRKVKIQVRPTQVVIPTIKARRLVISDVDDTVLHSEATDTARLVLNTVTGSSWTRRGFPGTATLYEGLQRGPNLDQDNPFFYVSSSPWNLYDFLTGFLRRAGLPTGPLFLRDMGVGTRRSGPSGHGEHKGAAIEELLEVHDLPVVLIGDTGQADPEIYHRVATQNPGRVEAILLRHVADEARRAAVEDLYADLDLPVVVARSSTEMAVVAESVGLLGPGWADRVAVDV